jgi:hypothetical protein
LLEAPDGRIYAVWITTRGPNAPAVVGAPVWPRQEKVEVRYWPAEGYSVRGLTLRDKRFLLAWVKTVSRRNHDYFYRILDRFDFKSFAVATQHSGR